MDTGSRKHGLAAMVIGGCIAGDNLELAAATFLAYSLMNVWMKLKG